NVNALNTSGSTPLHIAANRGTEAIVTFLLANGAQVNIQNNNGDTPLLRALKNRDKNTAILLLKAGADPALTNEAGESAFDLAQQFNTYLYKELFKYQEKLNQEAIKKS